MSSSHVLFTGGRVFDGAHHLGDASVLVVDGRVAAVGPGGAVRDRARAEGAVEEVSLDGGLLCPAFLDAHMHPLVGGLERMWCEMNSLGSAEEYLDALSRHHEEHPGDGWFRAGGWSVDAFGPQGPTAELLDSVVPDRPAFIPSSDHHDAWVNSRALEVAGITADTPDPRDGWFERDEHGHPTGTIREAAMWMVQRHVTTTPEEYRGAMLAAQEFLFSWGVTGWHDALVGGYAGIDDPTSTYLDLIGDGRLRARVRASLWWDRHRGTEQVADLVAERRRLAESGLDAGSVKLMVDGISETFTASVGEPYLDLTGCRCGDRGMAFLEPQELQAAVSALDEAGFDCHFHAIGDRAVHDALDAVEAARRANGLRDQRHQIAHLQLVRPEDRPRFRSLRVTANLEGAWASADTPAVQAFAEHLDAERMRWHYPFADIADAGADLAGGSDWPVNPPEPVTSVHVLVNRTSPGPGAPEPLVADQGLDLRAALAAYTSGTARVNRWADLGTLQVGARADLVVLDRDPFDGPAEAIGEAQVRATYLAGERVFDR